MAVQHGSKTKTYFAHLIIENMLLCKVSLVLYGGRRAIVIGF